jgi:hypothetical protein
MYRFCCHLNEVESGEVTMLMQVWSAVRGRNVTPPRPAHLKVTLPEQDEADNLIADSDDPPTFGCMPISGFSLILAYQDAKGQVSERRITCHLLEVAGQHTYLRAFCHEREARRQFRLDRIVSVIDLHTGEVLADPPRFFRQFALDRAQASALHWGLGVQSRADLVAGLNVLRFMGTCDREWHPLERDAVETFVSSYWLRSEAPGEPPVDDIVAHAERLSPDAETFYVSLTRCHGSPVLGRIIRRHIQSVVDADGRLASEEFYWGGAVDDYLNSLSN